MKLLFIGDRLQGTPDKRTNDEDYLQQLSRLPALVGHQMVTSFAKRETATEVSLLAKQHKVDAVICSQQSLMVAALKQQPDFVQQESSGAR